MDITGVAKVDIPLKKYRTYTLFARIKATDKDEFLSTWNKDLILYKFCQNGRVFRSSNIENDDRKRQAYKK